MPQDSGAALGATVSIRMNCAFGRGLVEKKLGAALVPLHQQIPLAR